MLFMYNMGLNFWSKLVSVWFTKNKNLNGSGIKES